MNADPYARHQYGTNADYQPPPPPGPAPLTEDVERLSVELRRALSALDKALSEKTARGEEAVRARDDLAATKALLKVARGETGQLKAKVAELEEELGKARKAESHALDIAHALRQKLR